MAKFLSDGLGWLKRSISEHENVADNNTSTEETTGATPRGNRLPNQRSLDLPSFSFFSEEDEEEEDMVDGNSPTKGRTERSVSEGGGVPPLIRPRNEGEEEEPPAPSKRLTTLGSALEPFSKNLDFS